MYMYIADLSALSTLVVERRQERRQERREFVLKCFGGAANLLVFYNTYTCVDLTCMYESVRLITLLAPHVYLIWHASKYCGRYTPPYCKASLLPDPC